MDFSSISRATAVGKALRAPLRLLPSQTKMRVLQGPLRGAVWIAGAHTHGCWLGSYEAPKQVQFAQLVRPGQCVYDVGANAGFYTLLASRLVGGAGRVVAFEPLPRNLAYLHAHLRLNRADNVTVLEAAVSDAVGIAKFQGTAGSAQGALSESGEIAVRTTTIDRVVSAGIVPPPSLIKMDIEGGEERALRGAAETLAQHRPTVLLATHGQAVHAACLGLLREAGYSVSAVGGGQVETADELLAMPR